MLPHIDAFNKILKLEKNFSKNTISSYLSDLKSFENFLVKKNIDFKTAFQGDDLLKEYFRSLSQENFSSRTVKRKYSSLSSYFNFLMEKKKIKKNPLSSVFTPKLEKKLPSILTLDEIKLIFKACEDHENELLGLRDRCMFELLYSAGLRVTEVCDLTMDNILFDEKLIRFFGKGDKERIIPLTYYALEWLNKYLFQTRKILSERKSYNSDYVFLSNNGKKMTRAAIWQIVKKYIYQLNIKKNVSPHTFRHSFATHLIDGGANLVVVQQLLGHSDISTTEIYTHLSRDYIDSEYLKAFKKNSN